MALLPLIPAALALVAATVSAWLRRPASALGYLLVACWSLWLSIATPLLVGAR